MEYYETCSFRKKKFKKIQKDKYKKISNTLKHVSVFFKPITQLIKIQLWINLQIFIFSRDILKYNNGTITDRRNILSNLPSA